MLKRRVIGVLVVNNGLVVQSINFSNYLPVGKPEIAASFFSQWGVDEIIFLDISATKFGLGPNFNLVKKIANQCQVPLTVGGGIKGVDDVHKLMASGADKVAVNQAFIKHPELLELIAKTYGKQSIVASIDALLINGTYCVYDYLNKKKMDITPWSYANHLENLGAGELLINSVDRDGAKLGFDIELVNQVCNHVHVPVIACGGVGVPKHLLDGLLYTGASGVAVANMLHFFEHSITLAKALICQHIQVRHETHNNYAKHSLDSMGRVLKIKDNYLDEMLYQKINKEII